MAGSHKKLRNNLIVLGQQTAREFRDVCKTERIKQTLGADAFENGPRRFAELTGLAERWARDKHKHFDQLVNDVNEARRVLNNPPGPASFAAYRTVHANLFTYWDQPDRPRLPRIGPCDDAHIGDLSQAIARRLLLGVTSPNHPEAYRWYQSIDKQSANAGRSMAATFLVDGCEIAWAHSGVIDQPLAHSGLTAFALTEAAPEYLLSCLGADGVHFIEGPGFSEAFRTMACDIQH